MKTWLKKETDYITVTGLVAIVAESTLDMSSQRHGLEVSGLGTRSGWSREPLSQTKGQENPRVPM